MTITSTNNQFTNPIEVYIHRLETGQALLDDTPENLIEVVGILKSYGIILDAYSTNLIYIAEKQFLVLFNFFKYFNDDFSFKKLLRHWWHDRINYEYAEYCMKTMLWHGGGGLDEYLDSPEFSKTAETVIQAKLKNNIFMLALHKTFPEFIPEQIRQFAYYSGLGQFWRVMSDMFLELSDRYDRGKIKSIPDVVELIKNALVAAANKPITYQVEIRGQQYDILPKSAGLTFLNDTAIPYVEAIFFRGTPFPGTVSYNAQAYQIPTEQSDFNYGALYADPLPIGGAGIPPTLLMHDMSRYLPDYLHDLYRQRKRGEDDILVQICQSFQKSMFCVTTAAVEGLAPYPLATTNSEEKTANRKYLKAWLKRLKDSEMLKINS